MLDPRSLRPDRAARRLRRDACAQAPAPSDAAKAMVGAWEISNAARDKTCPLAFKLDAGAGGFKLELDPAAAPRSRR